MKNSIVIITSFFLLINFNASAQFGYIKKAAKSVGGAAKKVGSTSKKYATKGGKKVWGTSKSVGKYGAKGARRAGGVTKKYTVKGGKKVWGATKTVGSYGAKGGKKVWRTTKKVGRATKKYATKGGKLVFEGGKSFAGVVVSSSGTILFQGYEITKEVVVNGRIPRYRRVSKQEYNFANKYLFGGALPRRSKILISNLLGVGNRPFVWPMGTGHFLMNMGGSGYNNALYDDGLFIHEITHVWQLHVTDDINWTIGGITSQIKNSATDEDVYNVTCNNNWGNMNLEQQASVSEKCFLDRKKGNFGECYEDKVVKYIRNGNEFD